MVGAEQRLWIMIDVETSGPVYGHHSMVELGAAVGSRERGVIDQLSVLITPVGEHVIQSRRAFRAAQERGVSPRDAMSRLSDWTRPHRDAGAQFVARPASFDWPWIVHYAWTYLGNNPFGFKAVCASSWFEARGRRFHVELPHIAVEDARLQLLHFLEAV
jgi:hypothetical protein